MNSDKITHSSHRHTLKFENTEVPFKCDGCKQDGIGSCYSCAKCRFNLHSHCAIPSAAISHPFYRKCSFQFMSRPPGEKPRYCNACEKDVTGFVYHCRGCGFDLHPCCAKLPKEQVIGDVKLSLYEKVSTSCLKCEKKGTSWSYRSSCKKHTLHVACARELLVESWHYKNVALTKGGDGTGRGLPTGVPCLKDRLQTTHNRSKSKKKKWWETIRLVLQFVISAVLGDPMTIIASAFVSLISLA